MHMFIAFDGEPDGAQALDENEEIEIHLKTLEELKAILNRGEIIQSMHVTACYYAFRYLDEKFF